MSRMLAVLPALALLTGCPSFTTMGTARTVPEGETQFYISTGGVQLRNWEATETSTGASTGTESLTLPAFEFGARSGVNDRVEIGGKLWFIGAELDSKFQLARSDSEGSGIDVALAPGISVYPFSTEDSLGNSTTAILSYVHLPLLIGINTGNGSQLVLGPRFSATLVSGNGEVGTVTWAGGSVGYAWKIGRNFRLLPEISWMKPLSVSSSATSSSDLRFEGSIVQGQLGFVFGG